MTSDIGHLAKKITRGKQACAPISTPGEQRRGSAVPTLLQTLGVAAALVSALAVMFAAVAVAPRCTPGHDLAIGGAIRIAGCQQGGPP